MKIAVVDYGLGNIYSVMAALSAVGAHADVDTDGSRIASCDLALVPGVAAFGAGIRNLEAQGQRAALDSHVDLERPLVGLCLGAQMFLTGSEESPEVGGLGYVDGWVRKLNSRQCAVPNQGWLRIHEVGHAGASMRLGIDSEYLYFSHSYGMHVESEGALLAEAPTNASSILAVYGVGNVVGVQFHPERSGPVGLGFLRRLLSFWD